MALHRVLLLPALLLCACEEGPPVAVGQLMSDRLEIVSDAAEPITAIDVFEGQQVDVGQSLLRQNTERVEARVREAEASVRGLEALLAEQVKGPRSETIEAQRASVEAVQVEVDLRELELERVQRLLANNLTAQDNVDQARARLDTARAQLASVRARLRELEAGTRDEVLEQTRQSLEQARARLEQVSLDKQRLHTLAPRAGVVDSLPFEVGERPAAGAVIAVLLTGQQPHARVYVPESIRVHITPGDQAIVHVDGLEAPLSGTIRRIASDASFTPYFSLTEHDRGRLSYLAEITLPEVDRRLPDGVPVEAEFPGIPITQ